MPEHTAICQVTFITGTSVHNIIYLRYELVFITS